MPLRSAIAVALLALVGAACSAPPPPALPPAPTTLTPAQIARQSTPAIVTVQSPHSLGTGFLVRPDGWVATNLHVIAGARSLVVVLPDHTQHPVLDVLAVDVKRDLAVIRFDAKAMPVLRLGDSGSVHPGDGVVAIGHPLGLEDTVSNGLISAIREVDPTLTVLQISAPIAPGSSGGPLFNDKGEVIGIAEMILLEGQNLNFGVPVDYLKQLVAHPHPVSFEAFVAATVKPMPNVARNVPHHDVAVLAGCAPEELDGLMRELGAAIEVGAPLYNRGEFAACFHVYAGASLDVEHKLRPVCAGPRRALADGRKRADKLADPAAQAWAMRDAFDGLADVIERKYGKR
ncbi:MAG TPA: trypsin-like peptidase domain-containing protein [Byssovorax sp.]